MNWPVERSIGGNRSLVSAFAALLLAALVPAACVLWFMTVAMRNERLAVEQRLTEVYLSHLTSLQRQLTTFWRNRQAALQSVSKSAPAETFATIVRSNLADSVVVYDRSGKLLYPSLAGPELFVRAEERDDWAAARELEFQKTNYLLAAEAYGRLAESSQEIHGKARAMQSQASCFLKAGRKDGALKRLTELANDPSLRHARSAPGVLIAPNAELLILKLEGDPASELRRRTQGDLTRWLNDYGDAELGSSQRRFLMEELKTLGVSGSVFPTLPAEVLALEYLERSPAFPTAPTLQRTPTPNLWQLPAADGTVVALFREDRLRSEMAAFINSLALPEVVVALLPPGGSLARQHPVPPQPAGELLPGWRLGLSFKGNDPFAAASQRQARLYLWSGVLVVAVIGILAVLAAHYVGAQVRLARLKDELVSNVTHELKTPLSGMRVIVDTLLAERYKDGAQLRSYLEMLAKENQRLSHLIENFLSFSRMERNTQRFDMAPVSLAAVVADAVSALHDRLRGPNCALEVNVPPDLPEIPGDREALTTVVINLLDNAWKYTPEEKRIEVRALREGGAVALQVTDNGVGLTRTQAARVFDRFYQADGSLSRRAGGCGLGLSVVQFIVQAHSGSVEVRSEPGKGSQFTVRLPISKGT